MIDRQVWVVEFEDQCGAWHVYDSGYDSGEEANEWAERWNAADPPTKYRVTKYVPEKP